MGEATCIYCRKPNSFTNEHVFPAGMGGDDPNFILKEMVCGACNTGLFSRLERELMRNSPWAFARQQNQKVGRSRGSKADAPRFVPSQCVLVDSDGRLLEAALGIGGRPKLLPQVHIKGRELKPTGSDVDELFGFFAELDGLLIEPLYLISKDTSSGCSEFEIQHLAWNERVYEVRATTRVPKPPSAGIWLESLAGNDGQEAGWPRIYKG